MTGPALRVIEPGLHTTVQDCGRPAGQALGVPVSGALDTETLRLANALVGNPAAEAALEILHLGPVLEVAAEAVRVALGAPAGMLEIDGPGGGHVPPWQTLTLRRGARIAVRGPHRASCAYLAVAGGFDLPAVMGSRATYVRGGFGGLSGRTLAAGDALKLRRDQAAAGPERRLGQPPAEYGMALRVVFGPQDDMFTDAARQTLCSAEYVVTHDADRMGLRLAGPPLRHVAAADIVSDGTAFGAIQVAGDGRPVLLLADRQTTGGYAKIATVCTADLPRAGRLRPNDRVRFAPIDVAAAQALRRWHEWGIQAMIAAITPV